MEQQIYDPIVQPLYNNNQCHWIQPLPELQHQYLHQADFTKPIYNANSDNYRSNMQFQSSPSPSPGGDFCPRILDIDPIYASSTLEGIKPHLIPDEQLARLENFLNRSRQMEVVWHGSFHLLTHALQSHIYFQPLFAQSPPADITWTEHKEDAKVRFKCDYCQHGWTSMKGKVVFFYNFDYASRTGVVFFKLFGQKCRTCMPETFQHAMWYPQEVIRVIRSLTYKIGQTVYQIPRPKVLRVRRGGSPKEKHEQEMCQACFEGRC